ncbi:MAG: hypothetical protein ABRQ26_11040, partial [Syntrophomonadaceae bacterium]
MSYVNPFNQLKSEYLESTLKFHSLYGTQMAEVLLKSKDSLWNSLHIIRSAPGGGKTSLLRLFTSESLNAIHMNQKINPEYESLANAARSIGALDKDGPSILGILIS